MPNSAADEAETFTKDSGYTIDLEAKLFIAAAVIYRPHRWIDRVRIHLSQKFYALDDGTMFF